MQWVQVKILAASMSQQIKNNLYIQGDQQHTTFALHGKLNIHTTAKIWQQCFDYLNQTQPKKLTIDLAELDYCDGSGVNLINALQKTQNNNLRSCDIIHANEKILQLLTVFSEQTQLQQHNESTQPPQNYLIRIGQEISSLTFYFKQNITFTGEIIYYLVKTICHPAKLRWKDVWYLLETTGPNALPIIALLGFLIGMIMGFQGAIALEKFGAKMFVPNFVGVTLLRELAPLLTAIMVIGRSASAFAAELGSMRLNQEVDALHTMGIDVIQFLVIPRVLACTIMLPILNIFTIVFGLVGCGFVTKLLGISIPLYLTQLTSALTITDFLGGMFKCILFGLIVASIGCMHGLRTRGGAMAVGHATTQTVVSGIVMLTIVDGIFSVLFYTLNL